MSERNISSEVSGSTPDPRALLGASTLELLGVETYEALQVVNPWRRLGNETYCCDFILEKDGSKSHLLAKACIKLFPYETMQEWLDRRQRLQEFGVSVPRLEAIDRATIVEEFIPYGFSTRHKEGSEEERSALEGAFHGLVRRVFAAGFSPVSFKDVRSRSQDAVIVDFGEDLGGYSPSNSRSIDIRAANAWFTECLRSGN